MLFFLVEEVGMTEQHRVLLLLTLEEEARKKHASSSSSSAFQILAKEPSTRKMGLKLTSLAGNVFTPQTQSLYSSRGGGVVIAPASRSNKEG